MAKSVNSNKSAGKVIRERKTAGKMATHKGKPKAKLHVAQPLKLRRLRRTQRRSIFSGAKKPTRPANITGQLQLLVNANFKLPTDFNYRVGQMVTRRRELNKPLQILSHQGGKIFLSDLTFATKAELCLAEESFFAPISG